MRELYNADTEPQPTTQPCDVYATITHSSTHILDVGLGFVKPFRKKACYYIYGRGEV